MEIPEQLWIIYNIFVATANDIDAFSDNKK